MCGREKRGGERERGGGGERGRERERERESEREREREKKRASLMILALTRRLIQLALQRRTFNSNHTLPCAYQLCARQKISAICTQIGLIGIKNMRNWICCWTGELEIAYLQCF